MSNGLPVPPVFSQRHHSTGILEYTILRYDVKYEVHLVRTFLCVCKIFCTLCFLVVFRKFSGVSVNFQSVTLRCLVSVTSAGRVCRGFNIVSFAWFHALAPVQACRRTPQETTFGQTVRGIDSSGKQHVLVKVLLFCGCGTTYIWTKVTLAVVLEYIGNWLYLKHHYLLPVHGM